MMTERTEDILLGRIATGEDRDNHAWRELEAMAQRDLEVWERAARSLHDEIVMRQSFEAALHLADGVEIPEAAFSAVPTEMENIRDERIVTINESLQFTPRAPGAPGVTHWSGWAVAALIAIAWIGAWMNPVGSLHNNGTLPLHGPGTGPAIAGPLLNGTSGASTVSFDHLTPDQAYDVYRLRGFAAGRLLEELPTLMIETRPSADGATVEVFYIRQLLERTTIDSVYRLGEDELGRSRMVPIRPERLLPRGTGQSGSPL